MAEKKYLNKDGFIYLWSEIKSFLLTNYVIKEGGKGLSSNDYTTSEKNKLSGIETGANKITNNNQLTNGAGYQTSAQVNAIVTGKGYQTESQVIALIDSAISDITGISIEVVSSLPPTGSNGVIYLVSNGGSGNNAYDEYIWVTSTNKYEFIGTTSTDLTGYLKEADLVAITNAEIEEIIGA